MDMGMYMLMDNMGTFIIPRSPKSRDGSSNTRRDQPLLPSWLPFSPSFPSSMNQALTVLLPKPWPSNTIIGDVAEGVFKRPVCTQWWDMMTMLSVLMF